MTLHFEINSFSVFCTTLNHGLTFVLNQKGKVFSKVTYNISVRAEFHCCFLKRKHRRNGKLQNFSLFSHLNVVLKKTFMGNEEIQMYDFIKV